MHTGQNAPGESSRAFTHAASHYDEDLDPNPIAWLVRRRSLLTLRRTFRPGNRVLEIGCGTGVEAIALARRGVRVLATDAAPGMIAVLEGKLAAGGPAHEVAGQIEPLVLSAEELPSLAERLGPASLDGAYSSLGPLNCIPDLAGVALALSRMVAPGGRVVISLLNRYCLWETAWFLRAGDPGRAFRRWKGAAEATSRFDARSTFTCYYWNRRSIERAFRPHFKVLRREGLPWLLPPFYLGGIAARFPRLLTLAARVDRRLARFWPAFDVGDHLLLVLEKV